MFTSDQKKIYDGLKSIGESLANFYADAVRMVDPECTIASKANLIAHMAREIDSILREVLAPERIANNIKASIGKDRGHFASVLAAVGKNDPENLLAKEWHSIASNFAGIAHRAKPDQSSKDATEMLELWVKYEKILLTIVGSFINITNRLDVIISQDIPQAGSLPAIKNILNDPKNANYFYSNLDKESWLTSLNDEGFFDLVSAPVISPQITVPEYWHAIKYLLSISTKVQGNDKHLLKKIIENIMNAYIKGTIDLHPYTITDITQIIINLDNFSFLNTEKLFFEAYSKRTHNMSWTLVHTELSEKLTQKLLNSGDKTGLLNLLDYFFGFNTYEEAAISFFDEEPGEPVLQKRPFVEKFYIGELGRLFGKQIVELLGIDAIRVVSSKLSEIDKLGAYSISSGGIPSIEPSSQSVYSSGWEDCLVYFIRDLAPFLNRGQLDELTDEMLYSKVQILQRLAIYFINKYFEAFADKWWRFIASIDKNTTIYIHEPYELFKKYSREFSDEQFEKTINWIETINPLDTYEWNGVIRDASAYRIRRWLTALSPMTLKSKELLLQKAQYYESKNNAQIEHPEFDSFGTTHYGFDHPMTLQEFQKFSVEEQIKFIQEFKPAHEHDTSEEGLAELLKYAVIENPEKYLYKLNHFLSLHSLYVNYLLDGVTKVLQSNKIDSFLLPLDFIEAKFSDETYTEEIEKKFHYKKWFASSISEFINVVVSKSVELQLTKDDSDRLIDLLLNLLQREEFQDNDEHIREGYINHIFNSIQGRLYGALINTLRFWGEIAGKSGQAIKWPDRVKEYFTNRLSSFDNANKDFSITLGMELPFLLYLDKQWVTDHFNEIFNEKDSNHFDYRIQSALSRNYTPSYALYEFYKTNNFFTKALDYLKVSSGALDTIMVYALYEWRFWNGDPGKNSLLATILNKKNPEQIKQLVDITYQQKLDAERAIFLWKKLLPIFNSTDELKDSYSILIGLFELQFNLDSGVFDLVSEIIEKMPPGGTMAYSLLKHLYKIADTNTELAGKLTLQVYEKKLVGPSFETDLLKLITKLYDDKQNVLANNICISVGETGSLILKNIYNKNN